MSRYFEIIITGRQLAGLVAAVVLLLAVAFGLGVAVRWFEPTTPPQEYIAVAPSFPTARPVPTVAASPSPTGAAEMAPTSAPATAVAAVATAAPPVPTLAPTTPPSPAETVVPTTAASPAIVAAAPVGRWVQATALSRRDQADGVRTHVMALGFTASQVVVQPAPRGKFRVRVGPFPDEESAGRVAARLQAQGFKGAFVVKAGE